MLGLIDKFEVKAGSTVKFDNLFTSLPLLDEVTELRIDALGTLWQNNFHGAPVANKTTLAKKHRASYDFATNGKNLVVSWLVNKAVTCATNMLPVILSAQLNSVDHCQPRNELMYQCQILLRTKTIKSVVLICSINLCPQIEFALGQRNGGGLLLHGW